MRTVANLRDDCTGSGLRAVLEAPPPRSALRELREAGLVAGGGAGDVARGGALARRRDGGLPCPLRKPTRSFLARPSAALLCSRTKSAIAIRQFLGPPLHRKATIRNSLHHNRKEIFICNSRANPCAPYSIPLKLRRLLRRMAPRGHAEFLTRGRPASLFKLSKLTQQFFSKLLYAHYECFALSVSVHYVFGECALHRATIF